jgi:hypothetical protein
VVAVSFFKMFDRLVIFHHKNVQSSYCSMA